MRLGARKDAETYWLTFRDPFETPEEIEQTYDSLEGDQLKLFRIICELLPQADEFARSHYQEYGWTPDILEKARVFTPGELLRPVPYFPSPWLCYQNSFEYAERTGCLYVEGLAINPTRAQIHAWNSTDGIDVLDYTWPFQHVNRYFGIVFDTSKLRELGYPSGGLLANLWQQTQDKQDGA